MNPLAGQTVVVLGGSSGIGLAVAQAAAAQDAQVILLSRSLPKLQAASKTIAGDARSIALDMLDNAAVGRAVASIGPIDHLVLTAIDREYALFGDLQAITSEQVECSFDKLRGFINVTRAAKSKLSNRASITMLSGAGAVKPPKGSGLAAARMPQLSASPGLSRSNWRPCGSIVLCRGRWIPHFTAKILNRCARGR
jgi:NADP-dependent 3-hydroxy acid dehydrogenase YdfG